MDQGVIPPLKLGSVFHIIQICVAAPTTLQNVSEDQIRLRILSLVLTMSGLGGVGMKN